MSQLLRIGIIGDLDPSRPSHRATNEALAHAAGALSVTLEIRWLPTPSLEQESGESLPTPPADDLYGDGGVGKTLRQYDALWCAPGSPYKSMAGALRAIRFARERGWPFLGT